MARTKVIARVLCGGTLMGQYKPADRLGCHLTLQSTRRKHATAVPRLCPKFPPFPGGQVTRSTRSRCHLDIHTGRVAPPAADGDTPLSPEHGVPSRPPSNSRRRSSRASCMWRPSGGRQTGVSHVPRTRARVRNRIESPDLHRMWARRLVLRCAAAPREPPPFPVEFPGLDLPWTVPAPPSCRLIRPPQSASAQAGGAPALLAS